MRKALVLFAVITLASGKLWAQAEGSSYETAVGFKFYPGALSIKHFTNDKTALEGLLSFWNYGFRLTGLYEIHGDINDAPGLKWYVGPGAHIGAWNNTWQQDYPGRAHGLQLGVDGVLGLDYKFTGAPIAVSLDIQPSLNIVGYTYFDVWGGLGVKYTF